MDIKQAIIDRLRATKRENIEAVINFMEKHNFFSVECGHHHEYKGGMASHAWQTYQIALRLYAENQASNPKAPKYSEDSIAICALLHDICDCSGMEYIHGHGLRSVEMLRELGFHLSDDEYLAIRYHMSISRHKGEALYEDGLRNQLRYLIHSSDGKSAKLRKGYADPKVPQQKSQEKDKFISKYIEALGIIGINVVNDSGDNMDAEELYAYLKNNC